MAPLAGLRAAALALLLAAAAASAASAPAELLGGAEAGGRWPRPPRRWTAKTARTLPRDQRKGAVMAAAAGKGCPNPQAGVLAMHNKLRAMHGVPALQWDAGLAAKAQAHADTCKWGHSDGRTLAGSGESIFSSTGTRYPFRGMDVCSWATYALYLEATAYNFDEPGASRDPAVVVGHFVNIVWAATTKIGCGYTACPGGKDYVVCWFNPGFYLSGGSNPATKTVAYGANVKRAACQAATKDDWCTACDGATCTACYERPQYGQASGRHPIELDPQLKKCASTWCPPGVPNCARCGANGKCLACAPGWRRNRVGACKLKIAG